jgi:hypothetical protein
MGLKYGLPEQVNRYRDPRSGGKRCSLFEDNREKTVLPVRRCESPARRDDGPPDLGNGAEIGRRCAMRPKK